ncbi:hypothetical protein C8R43DRAFT_965272 [Mycena crocata]|nr:hypothetical protein C8R43DRAFT_965272 [Mycena crocata]
MSIWVTLKSVILRFSICADNDTQPTAKMDFKTMTLTPIAGRAAPNDDEPGPSKRVVVSGPSRVTYDALVEQVGFTKQAAAEERNRRRELEAEVKQLREQLQKAPAIPTSESETTSWVSEYEKEAQEHYQGKLKEMKEKFQQELTRLRELDRLAAEDGGAIRDLKRKNASQISLVKQLLTLVDVRSSCRQILLSKNKIMRGTCPRKNNEIAAILGRLRPSNPKTIVPGAFPPADPVLVPQFITEQTKRARYLETVYKRADKGARIPILPLQPAASSSETREIPEEVLTFDDQDEQSVAFVTNIVKRVLAEMRITEVQVHEEKAAKRGPSKRAMDIKVQQSKLTEGEDILYKLEFKINSSQRAFREVWRTTFQRVTAAEFSDYQPVSVDKVIACNAGEVGPDEADLTLDFSEGFMSSLWNKELLQRLTSSFLEARSRGPNKYGLPDVSAEYVMGEYYGHLKRSQETWALWQPRYNKLTGTCETANEVKIRVEAYLKKRQSSVNGRGARQRKYKRRVKVVKSLIDIKIERGDVDLESWRFLLRILEHLGVGGMSSEDNGVGEFQGRTTPIFVVRLCPWRAQTVTDYMKLVDQSGSSMATNIHALPRERSASLKGTTPAPTGMPRKMYDEAWLANIKEKRPRYYEEELRISEEAFELLVVATSNLTS